MGLDEATLGRLLRTTAPCCRRRDTLAEKGASLRRHLNLDESELKKLIRVQPTLLGHNATQLRRKIGAPDGVDCAHERELGGRLRCPPLLATSARRVLAPAITRCARSTRPGHGAAHPRAAPNALRAATSALD